MGKRAAFTEEELAARNTRLPAGGAAGARARGKIVEWDDARGFGFVSEGTGGRTFVHIREFEDRIKRPAVGDRVNFIVGADATGRRCAKQVVQEGWGGGIGLIALLVLGALLVAPVLAAREFAPREMWPWLAGGAALVSLIAFGLYALDKRRARRGEWRVPESSLHFWALIGGWPGAFLAQRLLRHKSSKFSFQFGFWLIVAIHQYVAIDALLGWRMFRAARLGLGEVLRKVIDL